MPKSPGIVSLRIRPCMASDIYSRKDTGSESKWRFYSSKTMSVRRLIQKLIAHSNLSQAALLLMHDGEVTGCDAGCQEVGTCSTRGGSQGMYITFTARNPKQGYQWSLKTTCVYQKVCAKATFSIVISGLPCRWGCCSIPRFGRFCVLFKKSLKGLCCLTILSALLFKCQ